MAKPFMDISDSLPRYYQVVQDLLNRIKGGEFPANTMLDPEIRLAKQYNVSRNTIRHAISILANEAYLTRIRGKGTFFLDRHGELTRDKWAISVEDLLQVTKLTKIDWKPMVIMEKPPAFLFQDLRLKKWNKVCYFEGIKCTDEESTSYLQVYLPYEIGIQIDPKERGQKSLFLFMQEKLGIEVTQVDQLTTIEKWSRDDHNYLNCKVNEHKVIMKRIYFCEDQPVEVSFNHYQADHFSIFYRLLRKG